jgi:hypothetical protein
LTHVKLDACPEGQGQAILKPELEEFDMRRSRQWLAGFMILGLISAQLISLAHACAGADAFAASAQTTTGPDAAMPADCPAMTNGASTRAACEAHCVPREQVDKGVDVRTAPMAPASPLIVRVAHPPVPASMRATPPLVRITAPPLSLLFGRFLI